MPFVLLFQQTTSQNSDTRCEWARGVAFARILLSAAFALVAVGSFVPQEARAAWGVEGTGYFLSGCDNKETSSLTQTCQITAVSTVEAGHVLIVGVVADNVDTGDGNTSLCSSVTDTQGNTYTKIREFTNGQGSAAAGATMCIFYSLISNQLSSAAGDSYTVTYSSEIVAKGAGSIEFTIGAGSVISTAGTPQDLADDNQDAGSMTISGLNNREHLFLRFIASETDNYGITQTTNYVSVHGGAAGSLTGSGGNEKSHLLLASEYRILTGTGDTSDPTMTDTTADRASIYIALDEAPPQAILTQREALFENDNGGTPDTNTITASGSPALIVEKGQRFAVRFLVDNTGNVSTTTQFHVQYDRNDGNWRSVTSGEIAAQLGISGATGDALSLKKTGYSCSFTNGKWHENTATSVAQTIGVNECTELAFMLSTATATPGSTYRFRLVSATSYAPFASVATPTITIVSSQTKKHSKNGPSAENPSLPATSDDLIYFLDATGYKAVASVDGMYDTATSTDTNVPISLFKLKNPNGNNTDPMVIQWTGHSSRAPTTDAVTLEIWNSSSVAWLALASNSTAGANTDFTLDSVTSGAALYDSKFFTYLRVRQAAAASAQRGLRTDQIRTAFSINATQTLDKIANLAAQTITGDGTSTSIHLQTNAGDIAGATNNVAESEYNSRDGVYSSATTTTATSYNVFLYRVKEPNNNRTSMFTVNWVGQSSTTQHPVVMQVFKFRGSATGWRTLASVTPPAPNQTFTVSGTVFTASSVNFQMDDFYDPDPSFDVIGTSVIAVRIYQQRVNQSTGTDTTLRTDMVTSIFGFIGLTQQSFRFMNDNGINPDENTPRGGIDEAITSVKRGERMNLRIQITATTTAGLGQIPLVRKNFRLQYVALNSSQSACTESAESAWQSIGDGEDPTSITSISPTSINVSRSLSGYHGQRLNQLKTAALPGSVTQRSGLFVESQDQISATSVVANSTDYFAIGPDQGTELSYAIHTGDALPGATFCFRLVMDDLGQAVNLKNYATPTTVKFISYQQYPKLTVVSSASDTLRYSKGIGENKRDVFTDLSSKMPGSWDATIAYLAYDSFNHLVFFGSTASDKIGKYDPASDTATDLSSKIPGSWNASVAYLAYDSFNHLVFFGSNADNRLGKYDPAADAFTDLSSKVPIFGGAFAAVQYLTYDSFNHLVFFGSGSFTNKFGKYDPASDTFTDLSSKVPSVFDVTNLTYDSFNHLVFFGSQIFDSARDFGKYDPATDTFTNLSSKIPGSWGTTAFAGRTYDSFNHLVFFGSEGNKFGKYDPASDTATDLSSKIPGSWNARVNYLTYDSFNHLIFVGSSETGSTKFGKYDPDTIASQSSAFRPGFFSVPDSQLFLDATGYSAIAIDDGVYDSVTSIAATGFTTSFPMFLFKVKNTNAVPLSDTMSLMWNGFSSLANDQTASTVLEIFNLSTSSWEVLAGNTAAGANTEFTLSGSVSANQANYYDSVTTIY